MAKDTNAFRTISEVAQELDVPQHVLRFWEGKFPQISPMKRGGGRRYYRPDEVDLLKAIRRLLHDDGYTIRGVQRLLKERGVRSITLAVFDRGEAQTQADSDTVDNDERDPAKIRTDEPTGAAIQSGPALSGPSIAPAALRRSLIDVARELQACRAILADARAIASSSPN